ncbi:MAG: C45 family autoproteolytic acyltransferase/hydrolase [Planctomycetota bacterium]|jgi:hypothetical protein
MHRHIAPLLLASLLPAQTGEQLLDREVRVLEVSGTPYERGLAHGRAMKSEIHEILGDFKADLEKTYKVEAETFIERFLKDTDFMPAIDKWTPGLLDEVRGIAEGADMPFDEVYTFQLADEIWSMGNWAMREKCTAIAVDRRGDQPTMVAQNMDIPGFYQKFPMLLKVRREEGPDTMVLTCPGLIGVNGMNSAAVAVCCNTLLQLRPSRTGLPCLFVVRGVLEREDLASAESWLKEIPHAVGQNYTIGDPSGAKAFECSAGDKVRFLPDPEADFTYHTNHPLVNRDWHPDYLARCEERGRKPEEGLRTCWRFATLQERCPLGSEITMNSIVDVLASRDNEQGPICGDWTYGCTVFVLEEKPTLYLAPGRPDRYGLQKFVF